MTARKAGRQKIVAAIEAAAPAPPAAPANAAPQMALASDRFKPDDNGWWRVPYEDKPRLWLSDPFEVLAATRDAESEAWGLLLRWQDMDRKRHEQVIPRSMLTGEGGEARALLAGGGLHLATSRAAREAFMELLADFRPKHRARWVPTLGWHHFDGKPCFVLPSQTFGEVQERVIFQQAERAADPFGQRGTLDEWRSEVASLCPGNILLLFGVSYAFAGPLLDLTGDSAGGVHLVGPSRSGKSTIQHVAASVWGGGAGGAKDYVHSWRATDSGLEEIACAHSDTLLVLDELSQLESRLAGQVAYMLANGSGRTRARRGGGNRRTLRFRTPFLSSGEVTLADKLAEAGQRVLAGQEARMVDLAADAGAGHGAFGQLHGCAAPHVMVEKLHLATQRCYGTAAPAFLELLFAELRRDADGFKRTLHRRLAALRDQWLQPLENAGEVVSGQVESVARRFALASVAGELATESGITGWETSVAADAVQQCFRRWLAARGTHGNREDAEAIRRIRDFIGQHGSRFDEWRESNIGDSAPPLPRDQQRGEAGRAGWKKVIIEDGLPVHRFYFLPSAYGDALAGLDRKAAAATLVEAGFLLPGSNGKNSKVLAPPGFNKTRLYEVKGSIMGSEVGMTD